MFKSCGCKICKAGIGKIFNDYVINENPTLSDAKNFLINNGVNADKKLIKNHLSAYNLSIDESEVKKPDLVLPKIDDNLDDYLDFSQYNFDYKNPNSLVEYLQKLHLKIHLNQCLLILKYQTDSINGLTVDMPNDLFRNTALSWKMLNDSTAINYLVNINSSIKKLESEGFEIMRYGYDENDTIDENNNDENEELESNE